jgi:hypothetical protein
MPALKTGFEAIGSVLEVVMTVQLSDPFEYCYGRT